MKSSAYSVGISDLIADSSTNQKISDSMLRKKQEVKNLIDLLPSSNREKSKKLES